MMGVVCRQGLWAAYVDAMLRAGFSSEAPVYLASGLLSYGDMQGMPTEGRPRNAWHPLTVHRHRVEGACASAAVLAHLCWGRV